MDRNSVTVLEYVEGMTTKKLAPAPRSPRPTPDECEHHKMRYSNSRDWFRCIYCGLIELCD